MSSRSVEDDPALRSGYIEDTLKTEIIVYLDILVFAGSVEDDPALRSGFIKGTLKTEIIVYLDIGRLTGNIHAKILNYIAHLILPLPAVLPAG